MQTFTLWMGLSTCLAINEQCGVALKVKWPNDLHWQGKKVAGMLTEARSDSEMLRDLVFGIGLNVNGVTDEYPPEVRRVASSLREATGRAFDLNAAAAKLIVALQKACDAFLEDRWRDVFREQWPLHDALVGRTVTVSQADADISGEYLGIDETGTLILRLADGQERRFFRGRCHLEETMSVLCIDIGNTRLHLGRVEGTQVSHTEDLPTPQVAKLLPERLAAEGFEGVAYCSVVPAATEALETCLREAGIDFAVRLDHAQCPGLAITYPNPSEVGPDRLANGIGAQVICGSAGDRDRHRDGHDV